MRYKVSKAYERWEWNSEQFSRMLGQGGQRVGCRPGKKSDVFHTARGGAYRKMQGAVTPAAHCEGPVQGRVLCGVQL